MRTGGMDPSRGKFRKRSPKQKKRKSAQPAGAPSQGQATAPGNTGETPHEMDGRTLPDGQGEGVAVPNTLQVPPPDGVASDSDAGLESSTGLDESMEGVDEVSCVTNPHPETQQPNLKRTLEPPVATTPVEPERTVVDIQQGFKVFETVLYEWT